MFERIWKGLTTNVAETDPNDPSESLRPIRADASPGVVADLVHQVGSTRDRWHVEASGQAAYGRDEATATTPLVVHLTHKTRLVGFVDDVTVTITPDGTGSVVTARSASRLGKGDFGQNRRNLTELLTAIRDRLSGR